MVKALQMRTLAPSPPSARASSHAAGAPKAAGASPKASGGAGKKLCAECKQPCSGLPLRCGGCKTTHYCSKDCQKKAWPSHKETCKAPAAGGPAQSPDGKIVPSDTAGSSQGTTGAAAPAPPHTPGPQGLNQALERVLEESAAGSTDRLESLFETSVLMFLRGDYRGAITQVPGGLIWVEGIALPEWTLPRDHHQGSQ